MLYYYSMIERTFDVADEWLFESLSSMSNQSKIDMSSGKLWRVTIIEAGISDNNNWYRPSVLKNSIKYFEGSPIRLYHYDGRRSGQSVHHDHMPGWVASKDSGSVTGNSVGQLRNVKFESVPSLRNPGQLVPALTATCYIIDPHLRSKLAEAWNTGLMDTNSRALFELSIEAEGPHIRISQNGRDIKRVESISKVREVTIVSRGAAGGRFLQMIESDYSESLKDDNPKKDFERSFDKDQGESDEEESHEKSSSKNEIKPDEDLDQQDISQIQKSIRLLRAGNLDLGIEILEDVSVSDPNEDEEEEEEEEGKNGSESNLLPKSDSSSNPSLSAKSPDSKKLKRESTKELSKMGRNQGPENDGSFQESDYVPRSEMREFARFVAMRDAEREAALTEAIESLSEERAWRESQEENQLLRECQSILAQKLRECPLPTSGKCLIAEEYDGAIFIESDLDDSIERQIRYTQKITEAVGSAGFSDNRMLESAGYSGGGGQGNRYVSVGRNPFDWIEAEFDRALGYDWKKDESLSESEKDTYRQLPMTPSIRRPLGVWHDDPEFGCSPGFVGRDALLREATSQSQGLAVVLQNSMTKSVLQNFAIQPAMWREIADTSPVANYLEQQLIVLGGLGRLPKVVQSDSGTTYLRLGIPSSDQMTFNVGNYGGLICVTREAIINDNLQVIQAYPQQAAESAIMSLNMLVFGTAIGYYGANSNGTINSATSYDNIPLYNAYHNNYQTAALDYDPLVTALNNLSNQRKPGNVGYLSSNITAGQNSFIVTTSEFAQSINIGDTIKIGTEKVVVLSVNSSTNTVTITGTFANSYSAVQSYGQLRIEQLSNPIAFQKATLVVPIELRAQAYTLLNSALKPGSTYAGMSDVSFLAPFSTNKELTPLAIHSMFLQNDINNWYVMADKAVRCGFLGGREDPQLLLQDNPLVNNVFSGDLISWKIFHEYGAAAKGHLMVQGSFV